MTITWLIVQDPVFSSSDTGHLCPLYFLFPAVLIKEYIILTPIYIKLNPSKPTQTMVSKYWIILYWHSGFGAYNRVWIFKHSFFSILLIHEESHGEVYRDFQPSLTSSAGGAKGMGSMHPQHILPNCQLCINTEPTTSIGRLIKSSRL